MKGTDIALVIFIGMVSFGISFWLGNMILGDPNDRTEQITYMDVLSDDLNEPSGEIFNPKAYNPTVEVFVGECEEGFTYDSENERCIDASGNVQGDTDDDDDDDGDDDEGGGEEGGGDQNNPTPGD